MRKQTKLVAVLSAAALLAIGASMTSFAAEGWAEENGTWVYYNKDGSQVSNEWKKSGDRWFYLDDNGEMAVDQLVDDGDNLYYVNEDGVMVANAWVKLANEDDADDEDAPAYYWYYFQNTGKAYKAGKTSTSFKTINGKKYTFDEDGKMLFGWVNKNSERMTDDYDWMSTDTVYYCGDENDGAQTTGWIQLHVLDNREEDDEDQDYWFYFKPSNGKKIYSSKDEGINGKKYTFDEAGKMESEWTEVATGSTASIASYKYYSSADDGARKTKGWFKVVPQEDVNPDDNEDDTEHWYYADGKGALYNSQIKKIGTKRYAFNTKGEMISGLQAIWFDTDGKTITNNKKLDDADKIDAASEQGSYDGTDYTGCYVYYFGDGEDGALRTGTQNLSIDGDSYGYAFNKSGSNPGRGYQGYKDKYYYQNGKKVKASKDDKYIAFTYNDVTKVVDVQDSESLMGKTAEEITAMNLKVVNTSGTAVKNKSKAVDGNDWYFVVDKSGKVTNYIENND